MGFRFRNRTSGKNAWINFSWSEKNGLRASVSAKAGPFTVNSGNGVQKGRVTTNLGGGLYHVSQNPSRSSKSPQLIDNSTAHALATVKPPWKNWAILCSGMMLGGWLFDLVFGVSVGLSFMFAMTLALGAVFAFMSFIQWFTR